MGDGSDEVDDIVAAWRRERPDVDTSPMEVLSRVDRLARHVDRARAAAFSHHALEGWEFDVLAALRRSGEPYRASPGSLVRATGVTSGTMTNRVDRLAARGLVRRDNDPDDRRSVRVELTEQGRTTVDGALVDLLEAERELLTALDEPGRRTLALALRDLLASYAAPTSADQASERHGPRGEARLHHDESGEHGTGEELGDR